MFTLRFVREGCDYKAYSVISYEVFRKIDGGAEVELSKKLSGQDSWTEHVGDDYLNKKCYITNLDGKTIDVIRQKEQENA